VVAPRVSGFGFRGAFPHLYTCSLLFCPSCEEIIARRIISSRDILLTRIPQQPRVAAGVRQEVRRHRRGLGERVQAVSQGLFGAGQGAVRPRHGQIDGSHTVLVLPYCMHLFRTSSLMIAGRGCTKTAPAQGCKGP
jgi:hypothetical protein